MLWKEKVEALSQQLLAGPKRTTMNGGQDSPRSDRESSECRSQSLLLEQSLSAKTGALSVVDNIREKEIV
jgi:hypothetical protein